MFCVFLLFLFALLAVAEKQQPPSATTTQRAYVVPSDDDDDDGDEPKKAAADDDDGGSTSSATAWLIETTRTSAALDWTTKARALLPAVDSLRSVRHKRCAVVGTAAHMRGSGAGDAIDAADAVFRVDFAPSGGERAADVGARTTYMLVGHSRENFPRRRSADDDGGDGAYRLLVAGATGALLANVSAATTTASPTKPLALSRAFNEMAAEIVTQKHHLLGTGDNSACDKTPTAARLCQPSPLFMALLVATQLCAERVDVYGVATPRAWFQDGPYYATQGKRAAAEAAARDDQDAEDDFRELRVEYMTVLAFTSPLVRATPPPLRQWMARHKLRLPSIALHRVEPTPAPPTPATTAATTTTAAATTTTSTKSLSTQSRLLITKAATSTSTATATAVATTTPWTRPWAGAAAARHQKVTHFSLDNSRTTPVTTTADDDESSASTSDSRAHVELVLGADAAAERSLASRLNRTQAKLADALQRLRRTEAAAATAAIQIVSAETTPSSLSSSTFTTNADAPPVLHHNRLPYPVQPPEYELVNVRLPKNETDFFHYKLPVSSNKYHKMRRLGAGTYGTVYLAKPDPNNTYDDDDIRRRYIDTRAPLVIKALKSGHKASLVPREALILRRLRGVPYCVQLVDVVHYTRGRTAFVFPYVNTTYYKKVYGQFDAADIRHYMRQILIAMDGAHSRGIVHMDFKPLNLFIDTARREAIVGDWGLSLLYKPNATHSWRTMTVYWKAPEVMLGSPNFNYAVDIWSVGVTFAGMLFGRHHYFPAHEPYRMIVQWIQQLGTDAWLRYLARYKIELDPKWSRRYLGNLFYPKRAWTRSITPGAAHLPTLEAIDLLDRMLRFDPAQRITARDALRHPYFTSQQTTHLEPDELLALHAAHTAPDYKANLPNPYPPPTMRPTRQHFPKAAVPTPPLPPGRLPPYKNLIKEN